MATKGAMRSDRVNVKVTRWPALVPFERTWHKEYVHWIWTSYLEQINRFSQGKRTDRQTWRQTEQQTIRPKTTLGHIKMHLVYGKQTTRCAYFVVQVVVWKVELCSCYDTRNRLKLILDFNFKGKAKWKALYYFSNVHIFFVVLMLIMGICSSRAKNRASVLPVCLLCCQGQHGTSDTRMS